MSRSRRAALKCGAATLGVLAVVGCTSDPTPQSGTVAPETAYVAIVRWEIEQNEPVLDEDGDVEIPVIYLAAASGETVDVGVQANVVATVDDTATIRFADQAADALDDEAVGEPVKDDGVLVVIDEFEIGQPTADARVMRYRSIDDETRWILELTATEAGVDVTEAVEVVDAAT
jgi:hypothetical protein